MDGQQNQASRVPVYSMNRRKLTQTRFLHQMVEEAFPHEFSARNHGQEMRLAGNEDMIVPIEYLMGIPYVRLSGNFPEVPNFHSGLNLGVGECGGSIAEANFSLPYATRPSFHPNVRKALGEEVEQGDA